MSRSFCSRLPRVLTGAHCVYCGHVTRVDDVTRRHRGVVFARVRMSAPTKHLVSSYGATTHVQR